MSKLEHQPIRVEENLELNTAFEANSTVDVNLTEGIQVPLSAEVTAHIHRWKIDEPNGEYSNGICECGCQKQFKNWIESADFVTNLEQKILRKSKSIRF